MARKKTTAIKPRELAEGETLLEADPSDFDLLKSDVVLEAALAVLPHFAAKTPDEAVSNALKMGVQFAEEWEKTLATLVGVEQDGETAETGKE
jgi:hypothetical protein